MRECWQSTPRKKVYETKCVQQIDLKHHDGLLYQENIFGSDKFNHESPDKIRLDFYLLTHIGARMITNAPTTDSDCSLLLGIETHGPSWAPWENSTQKLPESKVRQQPQAA